MRLILVINLYLSLACFADTLTKNKFIMAESLYVNNDLFMAEKIFKELANEIPSDDYTFLSLSRLIDIAEKTGDSVLFKEMLGVLKNTTRSSSNAYNSLIYIIAKYLLHTGSHEASIGFSNSVDRNSLYYPKALYLKATGLSKLKRYSDALFVFETIIKLKSDYATKDIKDASILGKARIFVLMKKYNKALLEYQKIDSLSPYYLKSQEETARLFVDKKDYEQALIHLETISLANKSIYLDDQVDNITNEESLTNMDQMKLKVLQGYLYIEEDKFDSAKQVFDELLLNYKKIKKIFLEDLNRFKLSDDLTQLISHPYSDGSPRSLITNAEFVIFNTNEKYSKAFGDWISEKDKRDFLRAMDLYFSIMQRSQLIEEYKNKKILSNEEIKLVEMKNIMNKILKEYVKSLIKTINAQLDEIGLKAQLGKIDIVWKTKESQTKKIKKIQEIKQDKLERIENKYKNILE